MKSVPTFSNDHKKLVPVRNSIYHDDCVGEDLFQGDDDDDEKRLRPLSRPFVPRSWSGNTTSVQTPAWCDNNTS